MKKVTLIVGLAGTTLGLLGMQKEAVHFESNEQTQTNPVTAPLDVSQEVVRGVQLMLDCACQIGALPLVQSLLEQKSLPMHGQNLRHRALKVGIRFKQLAVVQYVFNLGVDEAEVQELFIWAVDNWLEGFTFLCRSGDFKKLKYKCFHDCALFLTPQHLHALMRQAGSNTHAIKQRADHANNVLKIVLQSGFMPEPQESLFDLEELQNLALVRLFLQKGINMRPFVQELRRRKLLPEMHEKYKDIDIERIAQCIEGYVDQNG